MRKSKQTGRALSIPYGVFVGVLHALGVLLLGTTFIAAMMHKEIIEEKNVGYAVMIILILGAFTGSKVSYIKIKRQKIVVSLLSGAVLYMILLSITALFFGGQYSGVGETGLLILCGSTLSTISNLNQNLTRKKPRVRMSHR